MTLPRTPLETSKLGPDAQRALSSPASRMLAARGMVPVTRPRDLLALLYQLGFDADERLKEMALSSARALPDGVMRGGLSDPDSDPRVLDFFSWALAGASSAAPAIELILTNPATHDETVVPLAARGTQGQVDLIATNEERLLRCPAIIAAMYGNRNARMSTVDRVVELAVRNGVKVMGIAAWDEICKVYAPGSREVAGISDADKDALFSRAAHVHADQPEPESGDTAPVPEESQTREIWALPVPMKIRLAMLGNAFDRAILIRDPKKIVAIAAVKSPGMTDAEVVKYAGLSTLAEEVIGYIANRRDWTKLYSVKLSLVNNPKCPLGLAMRLLPLLREKDVDSLARSKGIPSALAAQARKLVMQRGAGRR
ncbi:MAG TPA: hypothetical protein VNO33_09490 [Kofleriaceae bacterium]|nr:hypothetical protein [Kofleriaceae bacterium]